MRVQVLVRLKSGVLDVQGKAIEHGLEGSGVAGFSDIRVGKLIELDIDAGDFETAKKKVTTVCEKLLANPIIENFEIRPS